MYIYICRCWTSKAAHQHGNGVQQTKYFIFFFLLITRYPLNLRNNNSNYIKKGNRNETEKNKSKSKKERKEKNKIFKEELPIEYV